MGENLRKKQWDAFVNAQAYIYLFFALWQKLHEFEEEIYRHMVNGSLKAPWEKKIRADNACLWPRNETATGDSDSQVRAAPACDLKLTWALDTFYVCRIPRKVIGSTYSKSKFSISIFFFPFPPFSNWRTFYLYLTETNEKKRQGFDSAFVLRFICEGEIQPPSPLFSV